jgi:hypothetical protein
VARLCVGLPTPWMACGLLSDPPSRPLLLSPKYLVTVNLILSATARILSRFWEPKVHGLRKGIPGGSPSMMTEPGLLLMRLYGTWTGYLMPRASPVDKRDSGAHQEPDRAGREHTEAQGPSVCRVCTWGPQRAL